MGGFAEHHDRLAALGVHVYAASVDPEDKAREVAAEVPFAVAHGVTRAQADLIGAWWEDRRGIVQPSEFLLDAKGKVLHASYSSGPLARTDPADVARMVEFLEARKKG